MKKKIKREMRYIRYKICRSVYYADQCPTDCRKNYLHIAKTVASVIAIAPFLLAFMIILIKLA